MKLCFLLVRLEVQRARPAPLNETVRLHVFPAEPTRVVKFRRIDENCWQARISIIIANRCPFTSRTGIRESSPGEADHHAPGEWPRLTGHEAYRRGVHFHARLLPRLSRDALLEGLSHLREASQRGVPPGRPPSIPPQEGMLAARAGNEHDDGRVDARVDARPAAAVGAPPGGPGLRLGRRRAASRAEPVRAVEGEEAVGRGEEGGVSSGRHRVAKVANRRGFDALRGQRDKSGRSVATAVRDVDGEVIRLFLLARGIFFANVSLVVDGSQSSQPGDRIGVVAEPTRIAIFIAQEQRLHLLHPLQSAHVRLDSAEGNDSRRRSSHHVHHFRG
mmetsp:Transcript_3278/g.6799  ORF Transcript_3278/g.6799 Transcript_3278/m.6799 type:complete len:332 (+) Transcript_3278:248-1243(+)